MERNPLIVIGVPQDGAGDENAVLEIWRQTVEMEIGTVIIDSPIGDPAADRAAQAGAYVYRTAATPAGDRSNYQTESGAERVAATINKFDRFYNHDVVINIHAKLPPLASDVIRALMYPLADMTVDVATIVSPVSAAEARSPDMVKVELEWLERRRVHVLTNSKVGRVKKFTRDLSESGQEPYYRHVPIYAYKRASLDRFIRFGPTVREMEERLEPERALANGMRVDAIMAEPQLVGAREIS